MSKNSLKLKIAYLYPDILHGFCDKMNIETFCKRALWRDIDTQIYEIQANEKIQASKFDFYYIGGSNLLALSTALKNLKQNKDELKVAQMSQVPMLAVNCGYLLFGNFYQLHNKPQVEAIKLLDVDAIAGKKQLNGNLIGTCEFLKNKTVVGYENHGILSYLKTQVSPFLILKKGKGNNGRDKTEGARYINTIGTNITSPILAQNPHLCDFLLATALKIKYKCRVPLTQLYDDIEWFSHNYILETK